MDNQKIQFILIVYIVSSRTSEMQPKLQLQLLLSNNKMEITKEPMISCSSPIKTSRKQMYPFHFNSKRNCLSFTLISSLSKESQKQNNTLTLLYFLIKSLKISCNSQLMLLTSLQLLSSRPWGLNLKVWLILGLLLFLDLSTKVKYILFNDRFLRSMSIRLKKWQWNQSMKKYLSLNLLVLSAKN